MSISEVIGGVAIQVEAQTSMTEAAPRSVGELLRRVTDGDPAVRMAAAHRAGPLGYEAVEPLASLMTNTNPGVVRAADHALHQIVHFAAGSKSRHLRGDVTDELVGLTESRRPLPVRRKAVRLLEFIGRDDAVPALASLLNDAELREDARLTLEQIPGRRATQALEKARSTASPEFRALLDKSLRHRRSTLKTVGTKETAA